MSLLLLEVVVDATAPVLLVEPLTEPLRLVESVLVVALPLCVELLLA